MNAHLREAACRAVLPQLSARLAAPWGSHGYGGGAAGDLLAVTALSEACPDLPLDVTLLEDGVVRLLAALSGQPLGMFDGACGMLYAALEVDRHFGFGMAEEAALEFDAYLLDCLRHDQDLPEQFDVVTGINGLTVYAGYRVGNTGTDLLDACIERLQQMSSQDENGTHWFSQPSWTRGFPVGKRSPLGYTDMGLAHGQAGVIASLAHACVSSGGGSDTARRLLEGGVRFMRSQEQHDCPYHFSAKAGEPWEGRCAWCYGDLGTVGALRLAAIALDDPSIDAWCERILLTLSGWKIADLQFDDPWLCHGSIGAAWLMRQVGPTYAALAGRYEKFHLHDGHDSLLERLEKNRSPQLGILEGAAGAVLALVGDQVKDVHWSLPFLAGCDALRSCNREAVFA